VELGRFTQGGQAWDLQKVGLGLLRLRSSRFATLVDWLGAVGAKKLANNLFSPITEYTLNHKLAVTSIEIELHDKADFTFIVFQIRGQTTL
jgi:hypothetical protein